MADPIRPQAPAPALDRPVNPRRFRLLFAGLLVGALLVIWGAWLNGIHALQRNAEAALAARIEVDTLLLEDHVSRSLDAVAARLQGLASITPAPPLGSPAVAPQALDELIYADRIIRSVSLVDGAGRVVASSSPGNLGVTVASGVLPGPGAPAGASGIAYGSVLAGRDLADIGTAGSAPDVRAWVVALPVTPGGVPHRWVAVLNPATFENLWIRLDEDEATELGLFDLRGQRVASHHPVIPPGVDLGRELAVQASAGLSGSFVPGDHPKLWASFRASARHPVVMVVVGHQGRIWAALAPERMRLTVIAGAVTLLVLIALALVWRGYLRYEASVIEISNQARAIGAHLMYTEAAPDGTILSVNQALLDASGYSREEIVGHTHGFLDSGVQPRSDYSDLWETISSGRIWKGSFRNRRRDGSFFWVNATIIPFFDAWGRLERYVTLCSDVTETVALSERYESERQKREELAQLNRDLAARANTDPLTGAATRHVFAAFIARVLDSASAGGDGAALLLLDIDRFKAVNDEYGHAAGDAVLSSLVRRWSERIRASDLLARLGGEEFCVILPSTGQAGALAIAEALRVAASGEPVPLAGGQPLVVTVSIGVATVQSSESVNVDDLMRAADSALYAAKRGGRDRVVVAAPAPGVAGRGQQQAAEASGHPELRGVGAAGDAGAADQRIVGAA